MVTLILAQFKYSPRNKEGFGLTDGEVHYNYTLLYRKTTCLKAGESTETAARINCDAGTAYVQYSRYIIYS